MNQSALFIRKSLRSLLLLGLFIFSGHAAHADLTISVYPSYGATSANSFCSGVPTNESYAGRNFASCWSVEDRLIDDKYTCTCRCKSGYQENTDGSCSYKQTETAGTKSDSQPADHSTNALNSQNPPWSGETSLTEPLSAGGSWFGSDEVAGTTVPYAPGHGPNDKYTPTSPSEAEYNAANEYLLSRDSENMRANNSAAIAETQDRINKLNQERSSAGTKDERKKLDGQIDTEEKRLGDLQASQHDLDAADAAAASGAGKIDPSQVRHPKELNLTSKVDPDDPCAYSAKINDKYKCKGTNTMVDAAKIADVAGQLGQMGAVMASGQQAQQSSTLQGTQSNTLNQASKMAKTTGIAQMAQGAMNLGLGATLFMKGRKHGKSVEEIKRGSFGGKDHIIEKGDQLDTIVYKDTPGDKERVGESIIQNFDLQDYYSVSKNSKFRGPSAEKCNAEKDAVKHQQCVAAHNEAYDRARNEAGNVINTIGNRARSEQRAAEEKAKGAAMEHLVKGAGNLVQGYLALETAKNLKDASDELAKPNPANPDGYKPSFQFDPLAPSNDDGGRETARLGGDPDTQAAPAGDESADKDPTDLGSPFLTSSGDPINGGPTPGAKDGSAGGAPGGSGGGGGFSASATNPDTGAGQEQEGVTPVEGGTGSYGAGGFARGGGGGGDGDEGNGSIADLLASLLPKKEEEVLGKNPLNFGQARDLASADEGFLGRDVNLFERVSEAYKAKSREGRIGRK